MGERKSAVEGTECSSWKRNNTLTAGVRAAALALCIFLCNRSLSGTLLKMTFVWQVDGFHCYGIHTLSMKLEYSLRTAARRRYCRPMRRVQHDLPPSLPLSLSPSVFGFGGDYSSVEPVRRTLPHRRIIRRVVPGRDVDDGGMERRVSTQQQPTPWSRILPL
jgi:hypothetical protein